MVNDDILIKVIRKRGHKTDWPMYVREMRKRLLEIKLGFMGIGDNHLSLVEFQDIKEGDLFIWDLYVESLKRSGDEAPILLQKLENGKALIEGIGNGIDSVRDPDRIKYRWRDTIDMPPIDPHFLVYRFDARPSVMTGGPSYYFIAKAYRDNRF
jgi:hypothetical protein